MKTMVQLGSEVMRPCVVKVAVFEYGDERAKALWPDLAVPDHAFYGTASRYDPTVKSETAFCSNHQAMYAASQYADDHIGWHQPIFIGWLDADQVQKMNSVPHFVWWLACDNADTFVNILHLYIKPEPSEYDRIVFWKKFIAVAVKELPPLPQHDPWQAYELVPRVSQAND